MSLSIRIFGSTSCDTCKEIMGDLTLMSIPYEFIDALADDDSIQDFCDIHNVGELPHLQVINGDKVLFEAIDAEIDLGTIVGDYPELLANE